jgi:hypothetical protein
LKTLKSLMQICMESSGPTKLLVTVVVPCSFVLLFCWLAAPFSNSAWIAVTIGALLLTLAAALLTLVLRVTVFAPDRVERYSSGQLRARGPHYRGDRHGHWTFWHENGWKECEGEYEDGSERRVWTFYFPSGQACSRGELDGWCRQGVWELWDDTGQALTEPDFLARYAGLPTQTDGFSLERFPTRGPHA